MPPLKQLLKERHASVINHGGVFSFSLTYSPELIEEIKAMKEEFTDKYLSTIATIPGSTLMLVCFKLKEPK